MHNGIGLRDLREPTLLGSAFYIRIIGGVTLSLPIHDIHDIHGGSIRRLV